MNNPSPDSAPKPPYFWTRFLDWHRSWLLSWRFWRRGLLGLAIFITVLALAGLEETWRGKRAWNKFVAERAVKGDILGVEVLNTPPIPDDQNFGTSPIWKPMFEFTWITNSDNSQIVRQMRDPEGATNIILAADPPGNSKDSPGIGNWRNGTPCNLETWQRAYRTTNKQGTYDYPVAAIPQTPTQDVLLALSRFDTNLALLRKYAAERPLCRYPVRYEDGPTASLPHLSPLKAMAQYLALRCNAELASGKTNEAFDDLRLLFRVTDTLHDEPFLITHLIYCAMIQIQTQPLWEGLVKRQWTEEQLAALQKDLEGHDMLASVKKAMLGERTKTYLVFEHMRAGRNLLPDARGAFGEYPSYGRLLAPFVGGFIYQNELACARPVAEWIDEVSFSHMSGRTVNLLNDPQKQLGHKSPYNIFAYIMLPALGRAHEKAAFGQNAFDLAAAACALERYRLANGSYPAELAALVPKFAAAVPNDVITDEPLKYRRTDDGLFLLYSVGANRKDDGGTVGIARSKSGKAIALDRNQGDWVWTFKKLVELGK